MEAIEKGATVEVNPNTVIRETPKDGVKPTDAEVVKEAAAKVSPAAEKPAESAPAKEEVKEEKVEKPEDAAERKSRTQKRIDKIIAKSKATVQQPQQYAPQGSTITDAMIKQAVDEGKTFEAIQLAKRQAAEQVVAQTRQSVNTDLSQQQYVQNWHNAREKANRAVYERHPEVLDVDEGTKKPEDVPIVKTLRDVYEESPGLLELANGPELALEIAEKRLGIIEGTKKAREEGKQEEAARQERTSTAAAVISSPAAGGSPSVSTKTSSLSPEQKLVARKMGMSEEEYSASLDRTPITGQAYYAKYKGMPKPRRG